jgi:hypothetical protein
MSHLTHHEIGDVGSREGSDVSGKASLSDPGPENKVLLRADPS